MTYLCRVETPFACFGFEVAHGFVTRSAPIAAWMVGKRARHMVTYWRARGGVVTWEAC